MYLAHNDTVSLYCADEVEKEDYLEHMGNYDCGIFVFKKSEGK